MSAAYTLACDGCGGKIALADLPPEITCPYCRHVQPIAPERRKALLDYQADVAGKLASAADEKQRTAAWDVWYGGRGGQSKNAAKVSYAIFGAMFGALFLLTFVAQMLLMSGQPALRPIGTLMMPIAVPILVSAAVIGQIVWYYGGQRRARAEATPPRTRATCPRCGATNAIAAGQVVERCTHCGASLLPSATMMNAGLDAAEALRFRAEVERHRTERSGMASVLRSSMGGVMGYVIIGSWLPITVFPTIAFTVDAITKGEAEPGLAALWGIAGLNVAILVFIYAWRRSRRERAAWVLDHASAPFAHRPVIGMDGFVGWLNSHWAGPVPLTDIAAGPYFHAAAITVAEYTGLVVLNPKGIGGGYPGYTTVYLAAWVPAVRAAHHRVDPSTTAAERTALDALGFQLVVDQAGLRAIGGERVAKRLTELPNGGALLAHVVTVLSSVAKRTDARPIQLDDGAK